MKRKEKNQMSKMKLALDVVTDLRNLAGSIETLVFALESNQKDSVASVEKKEAKENKESEKSAKPPKAKLPTLEDVRAKLAALSQVGKQVQVKELITGFGAKKLSDIPEEKYPELLAEADKL
jgi:ribosomal protein S24E